jgi:hypothetical protein
VNPTVGRRPDGIFLDEWLWCILHFGTVISNLGCTSYQASGDVRIDHFLCSHLKRKLS